MCIFSVFKFFTLPGTKLSRWPDSGRILVHINLTRGICLRWEDRSCHIFTIVGTAPHDLVNSSLAY